MPPKVEDATMRTFLAIGSLCCVECLGVNLCFMPGDAYFIAEVSRKTENALNANRPTLEYYHKSEDVMFCGYAGFNRLTLVGEYEPLRRRAREVLAKLKRKRRDDDKGRVLVFVYDREIDWASAATVGLRYNESWDRIPDEALKSDARKLGPGHLEAARYQTLNKRKSAERHDKFYAPSVPGLPAQTSRGVAWGVSGPLIETPAKIDASQVQLVFVEERRIEELLQPRRLVRFISVNSDASTLWTLIWDKEKRARLADSRSLDLAK